MLHTQANPAVILHAYEQATQPTFEQADAHFNLHYFASAKVHRIRFQQLA